ncbi:MAG: radical SAM protein [Oligoflexia bacterium]|nr:radical SAM protein [Oligoflexia bacterium]
MNKQAPPPSTKEIVARINTIIPSSFVDGPGHRFVVFFQGCNLDCSYCHNPETKRDVPFTAFTVDELLDSVVMELPFIDGVTFSGGECTLQPAFIEAFSKSLAQKSGSSGSKVKLILDTNGCFNQEVYSQLKNCIQGFILDIKAISATVHQKLTGVHNQLILDNALQMARDGLLVEVRTVLVPGDNDTPVELNSLRKFYQQLKDYNQGNEIKFRLIESSNMER